MVDLPRRHLQQDRSTGNEIDEFKDGPPASRRITLQISYRPHDLYSWVWAAWANCNSFHLMPTGLGPVEKVSLHATS